MMSNLAPGAQAIALLSGTDCPQCSLLLPVVQLVVGAAVDRKIESARLLGQRLALTRVWLYLLATPFPGQAVPSE